MSRRALAVQNPGRWPPRPGRFTPYRIRSAHRGQGGRQLGMMSRFSGTNNAISRVGKQASPEICVRRVLHRVLSSAPEVVVPRHPRCAMRFPSPAPSCPMRRGFVSGEGSFVLPGVIARLPNDGLGPGRRPLQARLRPQRVSNAGTLAQMFTFAHVPWFPLTGAVRGARAARSAGTRAPRRPG